MVKSLQNNSSSRETRFQSVKETQADLEIRANTLLRKLLTINQPQTSEAEEKWFKELTRVKARLHGQRGLLAEAKLRVGEGRKLVEMAGKRSSGETENDEETVVGKRKFDGRVMEAIDEAYVPVSLTVLIN